MKLKRIIYVLVCMSLTTCSINNSKADNSITDNKRIYKIAEIPDNAVKRVYEDAFSYEIKFSNIIYNALYKNKVIKIKIPIFQGYLDDVKYGDFIDFCRTKNMLRPDAVESDFVILTKKGEVKKTLLEFIKFYEGNILKGYEKPINMFGESGEWWIDYEFIAENILCLLRIRVKADQKYYNKPDELFKSIEDIHVDENMKVLSFHYQIRIDYKSY